MLLAFAENFHKNVAKTKSKSVSQCVRTLTYASPVYNNN